MKKFALIFVFAAAASAFAVSYKNNTYQKLANEYTKKAEAALDAGEYALSEEYAARRRALIGELVRRAGSRIIVMAGCGVRPANIAQIAADSGAKEFHSSCISENWL